MLNVCTVSTDGAPDRRGRSHTGRLQRVRRDGGALREARVAGRRAHQRGREIQTRRLDEVTAWIDRYRQLWSARFDELDQVLADLKQKEKERSAR